MEMVKIACGTQRFLERDLRARLLAGYLRVSLRRAFPCESIRPPRLKRKFSSRSRMCCSQTLSVTRSCRSHQQRAVVERLNEIVRGTDEFQAAETAGRLIKIPTGDGITLVF